MDNLAYLVPNKKLLLIGMSPSGLDCTLIPRLKDLGVTVEVVELCHEHAEWVRNCFGLKVYEQDVATFNNFNDYDCVMWRQGPEHVSKELFKGVFDKVNVNMLIECPWGSDENEDHISAWSPKEFINVGFSKVLLSNERWAGNSRPMICGIKLIEEVEDF